MNRIRVELGDRSYDITIAENLLKRVGELTLEAKGKSCKTAIITNPRVHSLYGKEVEKSLKRSGFKVFTHFIGDGETAKSVRMLESVWTFLIENNFERNDLIVALGGGVVGDLAGFAAATYQRGMDFVQIPTTLLAQIDSSVGGKTGVNHKLGKNLIGAFHQPRAVIIDTNTLKSLAPREMSAGMYEAVKYGIIRDKKLSDFILEHEWHPANLDSAATTYLIDQCCRIKADVVAADERESGLRRILNFGHTIGHAFEAVTHYRRFKHGEAVGQGMKCATVIAEKMGIVQSNDANEIINRINALGKLPRIDDLDKKEIIAAIQHDKKVVNGKVPFILPAKIGEVVIRNDVSSALIKSIF